MAKKPTPTPATAPASDAARYAVDKGVPMPSRSPRRERRYPIKELAVGDSFLVPAEDLQKNLCQAVRSTATTYGYKIASRSMPEGMRFWRIS